MEKIDVLIRSEAQARANRRVGVGGKRPAQIIPPPTNLINFLVLEALRPRCSPHHAILGIAAILQ